MTGEPEAEGERWRDACRAAALLAVDPGGLKGVRLVARHGPVRDAWLAAVATFFEACGPVRRIAAGIAEGRLVGGLDLAATLSSGRPVMQQGVLSDADGGLVILAMAERAAVPATSILAAALDDGAVRIERDGFSRMTPARFALIALDEGADDDEALAPALADRLGLTVECNALAWREAPAFTLDAQRIAAARARLGSVAIDDRILEALVAAAAAAGHGSLRRAAFLLGAARAAAAYEGRCAVAPEDALTALRLVLGVSAVAPGQADDHEQEGAPEEIEEAAEENPERSEDAGLDESPDETRDETDKAAIDPAELRDILMAAAEALLPKDVLKDGTAAAGRSRERARAGKAGAERERGARGRVVGHTARPPYPGARPDVLATLREAAPWQRLRAAGVSPVEGGGQGQAPRPIAAEPPRLTADGHQGSDAGKPRLRILPRDFRYARRREKAETTALFVVDASGSAALERLAETKGAIELLLAECYVRRDSVALVAFRGAGADILLPATRSLVRAKRALAALPGGGGTPLAAGILAAHRLAAVTARDGGSVVTVFLTDGRGNIALDGTPDRAAATADAATTARLFRSARMRSIVIDPSMRPQPKAADLARDLGAEYLALPRAGAHRLAGEVAARMQAERPPAAPGGPR